MSSKRPIECSSPSSSSSNEGEEERKRARVEDAKEERFCYLCGDYKSPETELVRCPAQLESKEHGVCKAHLSDQWFARCGVCRVPWAVGSLDRSVPVTPTEATPPRAPTTALAKKRAAAVITDVHAEEDRRQAIWKTFKKMMADPKLNDIAEMTKIVSFRNAWFMFKQLREPALQECSALMGSTHRNRTYTYDMLTTMCYRVGKENARRMVMHQPYIFRYLACQNNLGFWGWLCCHWTIDELLAETERNQLEPEDLFCYPLYYRAHTALVRVVELVRKHRCFHRVFNARSKAKAAAIWLSESMGTYDNMKGVYWDPPIPINNDVVDYLAPWFTKDHEVLELIARNGNLDTKRFWDINEFRIDNWKDDESCTMPDRFLMPFLRLAPRGWVYVPKAHDSLIHPALAPFLPITVLFVRTNELVVYRKSDFENWGFKAPRTSTTVCQGYHLLVVKDSESPAKIEGEVKLKTLLTVTYQRAEQRNRVQLYHYQGNKDLTEISQSYTKFQELDNLGWIHKIRPGTLFRFERTFAMDFVAKGPSVPE